MRVFPKHFAPDVDTKSEALGGPFKSDQCLSDRALGMCDHMCEFLELRNVEVGPVGESRAKSRLTRLFGRRRHVILLALATPGHFHRLANVRASANPQSGMQATFTGS
jgi:hypothetical protein